MDAQPGNEQPTIDRYIAFDIETSGAYLPFSRNHAGANAILAIGVCVIDVPAQNPTDYHVQHSEYIVLKIPPSSEFEMDCWNEFWNKDGAKCLEKLRAHSSPKTNSRAAQWVWGTLHRWQAFEGKVYLCSDNPAFDLAWIDWLVCSELHNVRPVSQYKVTATNKGDRPMYSVPLDLGSAGKAILRARGYPDPGRKRWEISKTIDTPHDHLPHNDARNMLETYLHILYSS